MVLKLRTKKCIEVSSSIWGDRIFMHVHRSYKIDLHGAIDVRGTKNMGSLVVQKYASAPVIGFRMGCGDPALCCSVIFYTSNSAHRLSCRWTDGQNIAARTNCVAQEPAAPEGKLLDPSSFARRQLLSMEMQTIIMRSNVTTRTIRKFAKRSLHSIETRYDSFNEPCGTSF